MRGPKPKPTKLKILHGNPGHRPLNDDEPQPDPSIPAPPAALLTGEAKAEWDRLTVELDEVSLLTQLDRGALAMYCITWSRWLLAEKMVRAKGTMLLSPTTKQLYPNPYLAVASKALDQLTRLGQLLGLDPSSRSRLHTQPKADPNTPRLEDFTRKRI